MVLRLHLESHRRMSRCRRCPIVFGIVPIACAWLVLASFLASGSQGAFIIGNSLANNDDGLPYTYDSNARYAFGIQIGATPVTLTDVTFRLRSPDGSQQTATLQLRSNPDVAGSNLGTLVTSGVNFSDSTFQTAPTLLSANTTYWLTLMGSPAGIVMAANNPAQTPSGPLATLVGLRSGPDGATIDVSGLPAPTLTVNGIAAVPEPACLGCATIASWVLTRIYRRRQRSKLRCAL